MPDVKSCAVCPPPPPPPPPGGGGQIVHGVKSGVAPLPDAA
ncbi:hypothetical protein AB23_4774 [Escherichia coli 6-319-05_S1_C1]|nr:hypothetical protein AB23_4774 [Escherichia coli 6-319-05_S1_C1]